MTCVWKNAFQASCSRCRSQQYQGRNKLERSLAAILSVTPLVTPSQASRYCTDFKVVGSRLKTATRGGHGREQGQEESVCSATCLGGAGTLRGKL